MATLPGSRNGGIYFVAGALVIAAGTIAYFAIETQLRRDRPAAFTPSEPPKTPAPARP